MSTSTSRAVKLAAVVLTGAVAMTGCGKDKEADKDQADATTTVSTSKAAEKDTEQDKAAAEKSEEAQKKEAEEKAAADRQRQRQDRAAAAERNATPPAITDPFAADVERPNIAPVEGAPASAEDAKAIDSLVKGYYAFDGNNTMRDVVGYMIGNSCQAVVRQSGGAEQIANEPMLDIPMKNLPQQVIPEYRGVTVSDTRVNGDTASATVTANVDGQSDTQVMRFARENGKWTFCDR
ncbi:hypothetical protein CATYP_07125 [Corynebacterium atypicum]|uniref:Secreted protein n=1 Tax=Corynebacterium atypicum TaxID=191610 RepID=A0ABN4DDB2_9CORY|nr:hypothetical protein [Corynebacterium atypicum]AIG64399.1 hypothetical protein CATYP_07125 [Corynebacterium atypicum]